MKNRLKLLRIKNNIKVEELAKTLGISTKKYLEYETSEKNLPLSTLIKISKIYNTSIDYIVGDTDVEFRN